MERLHLWTLEERRNRWDLIEVFKIIKGYTKCKISDLFILDNRCKGTWGPSAKLIRTRNNRNVLKFFFSRRVIERLNQLEQHVVDASSINMYIYIDLYSLLRQKTQKHTTHNNTQMIKMTINDR